MNRYDFTKRAAVVTGGAQGIGYAVAERLLEGGARVALWDRDEGALAEARARLGDVQTVLVDLTDRDAVAKATSRTQEGFGQIDVLVHSAGIAGANATVADYAPEEWSRVIDVDLNAAFHVNQAIVRTMIARGYGRIVNIASLAGQNGGSATGAHYAAAKGGAITLTKVFARDLAAHGVTVNAISPGPLDLAIVHESVPADKLDKVIAGIPVGRLGSADYIADVAVLLASPDAYFANGACWDVNGGLYMR